MAEGIIALELTKYSQFVLWRLEGRGEKQTKVPYSVRGTHASSTNPRTWSSYEEAKAAFDAAEGRYTGIGFVLTDNDPFIGVDLDHCIKDGVVEEWAQAIINTLNSYTEVTPSGEGLRTFIKGELPPQGRKRGPFEVYSNARFLTLTGNHLEGTPTEIYDRQEEILAVHTQIFGQQSPLDLNGNGNGASANGNGNGHHGDLTSAAAHGASSDWADAYLIEQIKSSKQGPKFTLLWAGQWDGHGYASASEADQALCNILSFWTGRNPERIDYLYRQSGLMRDKWDEPHYSGGKTYGQGTIENAIQSSGSYFDNMKGETQEAAAMRRSNALEWLRGQPGFDELDVTGVRQIGKHINAAYQLLSNIWGPVEMGSPGEMNSWLKPRANIMARTQVVLPPAYAKKEVWNAVLDSINLLIREAGGPEDDHSGPGDVTRSYLQKFAASFEGVRYDLTSTEDKLSIIANLRGSRGYMENHSCFVTTEGEVILQANALAGWAHSEFGESLTSKQVAQDLMRLGFKSGHKIQARDPEQNGKVVSVEVFISPKGFYEGI